MRASSVLSSTMAKFCIRRTRGPNTNVMSYNLILSAMVARVGGVWWISMLRIMAAVKDKVN